MAKKQISGVTKSCWMLTEFRTNPAQNVSRDWNYEIHETPRIKSESSYNRCTYCGKHISVVFWDFSLAAYLFWHSFILLGWIPAHSKSKWHVRLWYGWASMLYFSWEKSRNPKNCPVDFCAKLLKNITLKQLDTTTTPEKVLVPSDVWQLDPIFLSEIRVWSSRSDWPVLTRDKIKNSKINSVDFCAKYHQNTTLQRLDDSPTPRCRCCLLKCLTLATPFWTKSFKFLSTAGPGGVRTHYEKHCQFRFVKTNATSSRDHQVFKRYF